MKLRMVMRVMRSQNSVCTSCNDLANPNGRGLITLYKTVQHYSATTRRQQVARWGFTYISWNNYQVTLPFGFFQLCENISLVSWMELASIPESIKPRHTPSIRIESSDWKCCGFYLLWINLSYTSQDDNRFVLLISHFSQRFIHQSLSP